MRLALPNTLLSLLTLLTSQTNAYTKLSDGSIRNLPSPGHDFDIRDGAILSPILKVRVPGTPAIDEVRHHFLNFFKTSLPDWTIELQNSTQQTALGKAITFVNIIATRDPPWAQAGEVGRLALAAHYDSKLTPDGFIGAIDSAAPCAMILHAAKALDPMLTRKWNAMQASGTTGNGLEEEKGVQVLLLDGEEAFISWTATDSVYGARSLAEHWDAEVNPAMSTYRTKISQISLFLLLDLLGAKSPGIPSYFQTTHWAYRNMEMLERRLRRLRVMHSADQAWLQDGHRTSGWSIGGIEDDHIPFMARGVEVLHMIPTPFPHVWHTLDDDGEHLDPITVEDWAHLTTAFAAEWLDLEGFMEGEQSGERSAGEAPGKMDRDELFPDQ